MLTKAYWDKLKVGNIIRWKMYGIFNLHILIEELNKYMIRNIVPIVLEYM